MGLLDFFSPEAGQRRTKWLHGLLNDEVAHYVPPNLREPLGLLAQMNPVNDIYQAGGDMRDGDYIGAATNTAAALAPIVGAVAARPAATALAQSGDDAARAIVDAFTMYQAGGKHAAGNFARMEDGMFAGPSAMTADLDALAKARSMADSGASRDDIWRDTGWFKGVDGKWRYEIDDSASTLNDYITSGAVDEWTPRDSIRMGETLQHDDLYSAYPEFAGIRSTGRVDSEMTKLRDALSPSRASPNNRGYYDPRGEGHINLTTSADDMRPVALHELQHGVQSTEGFARGSNLEAAASPTYKVNAANRRETAEILGIIQDAENMNIDPFEAIGIVTDNPEKLERFRRLYVEYGSQGLRDRLYDLDAQIARDNPNEMYRRAAGEVESRNVEARADMTMDERRATPPWQTQDVPDADQIVRFDPRLAHLRNLSAGVGGLGLFSVMQDNEKDEIRRYLEQVQ